jgi:hypothetical protein
MIGEDEKIQGEGLDRWHTWHTQVKWAMHSNILSKPVGRTVMPMHRWDLDQGKVLVHMVMGAIKCIEFIDKLNDLQLLRKDPVPWG